MSTDSAHTPCITGSGVVTALGFSVLSNFEPLTENVSAIREMDDGATAPMLTQAAVVSAPRLRTKVPEDMESQLKFLNPSGQLALNAVKEAVDTASAAGLDLDAIEPGRKSLYLAQVDSADWDCHDFQAGFVAGEATGTAPEDMAKLNKQATRRTKPFFLLESLKNNVYSFVASWLGMMGPNTAVAGLSHSGFPAVDLALRSIKQGRIDVAMVLGAAVITDPVSRLEFGARDAERDGDEPTIPGDGAGALMLESEANVVARGGSVLARITGWAAAMGEPDGGSPSAETLGHAVDEAIRQSGREKIEVVIVPRLAGTAHRALLGRPVFEGGQAIAMRPLTGHLATAMEPVEIAMTAALLQPGHAALITSAGFYGQAGALVIEKPAGVTTAAAVNPAS